MNMTDEQIGELVPQLLERAQRAEALLLQSVGDVECMEILKNTAKELGGDLLRADGELRTMHMFADQAIALGDLGGGTVILNALATIRRLSKEMKSELPLWEEQDRARKAEAELRKCYKDLEELTGERNALKAMLADAEARNAVLQRRLYAALDMYAERAAGCPFASCGDVTKQDCMKCWRDYALMKLKEVQP